jgi:methionine biosynthesis protein MetW
MRSDLDILQSWIKQGSRVLDLGCGDGTLLDMLTRNKQIQGLGLEIDPFNITTCIARGLNVIEHDLDGGLSSFRSNSFDTVVMTQTLQAVRYPHLVLDEMLRVGKQCIIGFPNFGHWRSRMYLSTQGKMPVSKFMPYTWYDTPNIHFCTVKDFEVLCQQKNLDIVDRAVVDQNNRRSVLTRRWPNLFCATAIYLVTK